MDKSIIRALECVSLLQTFPQNSAVCKQLEDLSEDIVRLNYLPGSEYGEIIENIQKKITKQNNLIIP